MSCTSLRLAATTPPARTETHRIWMFWISSEEGDRVLAIQVKSTEYAKLVNAQ